MHRDLLLDLEVEGPLAEARRHRRAEQVGPLERAVRFAEVRERRFGNRGVELERLGQRVGGDRAPAALLPAREERLEHFVEQLSSLLRAQARLVIPLFVEAQHARREVLERDTRDSARPD